MRYRSTRSKTTETFSFKQVFLRGLAEDGGLYIPEYIPKLEVSQLIGKTFEDIAFDVFRLYISKEDIPDEIIRDIILHSFRRFKSYPATPLVRLENNLYILELFHGPSYSFKDIALQTIGRFLEYYSGGNEIKVVGATSGDTGSAAICSVKDIPNVECYILYPEGKISEIQQAQMTTVKNKNVNCLAVEGTFDDCQRITKSLFMDKEMKLTAVNSINWVRVMTQIVYYVYACVQLEESANYIIPTGNFGNALAGFYAKRMGMPINKLVVATNENDILFRFFDSGIYEVFPVKQTVAPAMDISIASNFERLLYYYGEDVSSCMEELRCRGKFSVCYSTYKDMSKDFISYMSNDKDIKEMIVDIHIDYNYIMDPHTAAGMYTYKSIYTRDTGDTRDARDTEMCVCLATAHPGKFGETVSEIVGYSDYIPEELSVLLTKEQRYIKVSCDYDVIKNVINKRM